MLNDVSGGVPLWRVSRFGHSASGFSYGLQMSAETGDCAFLFL